MEMTFVPKGGKARKKIQAIVYCQKVKYPEVSLSALWENITSGELVSIDTLYYGFFIFMLFMFFIGNRFCDDYEDESAKLGDVVQKELKSQDYSSDAEKAEQNKP